MQEYINAQFDELTCGVAELKQQTPEIEKSQMYVPMPSDGDINHICGNGGSAAQSQHLAAELVGRYKMNRPAMNSISLTVDTSNLTAIGNDYGYDVIFPPVGRCRPRRRYSYRPVYQWQLFKCRSSF